MAPTLPYTGNKSKIISGVGLEPATLRILAMNYDGAPGHRGLMTHTRFRPIRVGELAVQSRKIFDRVNIQKSNEVLENFTFKSMSHRNK